MILEPKNTMYIHVLNLCTPIDFEFQPQKSGRSLAVPFHSSHYPPTADFFLSTASLAVRRSVHFSDLNAEALRFLRQNLLLDHPLGTYFYTFFVFLAKTPRKYIVELHTLNSKFLSSSGSTGPSCHVNLCHDTIDLRFDLCFL